MKKISEVNPPVLWFWIFLISLLGLAFIFAPTAKLLNLNEIRFATTKSSLLYFKNIRSYYYDIDESKKPLVVYRLKDRNKNPEPYSINFSIISNPLNDEAYVYLETEDTGKQSDNLSVFIIKSDSDTLFYNSIQKANNEQHFELAASIYQSLIKGSKIYLKDSSSKIIELWKDEYFRQNAEIVLTDYFKLVNKL